MKKILLGLALVSSVLMLTGCQEDVNINMDTIDTEILNLTTGKFDIMAIDVSSIGAYSEKLMDVYDYDFEDVLGLDSSLVLSSVVKYDEEEEQLLAVVKPVTDKEEEVKEALDEFTEDLDVLKSDYEGYLIYIVSNNNQLVLERVKNASANIFYNLMEVTTDQIEQVLGLKPEDVSEFTMYIPTMMTSAQTFVVVKPADGMEDAVKEAIDTYMTNLENQWSTYLPDQYELVKNRKVEKVGEYLVYIISSDNDLVFDAIKN